MLGNESNEVLQMNNVCFLYMDKVNAVLEKNNDRNFL